MKNLLTLLFAALLLTACGTAPKESNPPAQPAPKADEKSGAKFKTGETVVAKWMQNSFYEGTVENVTDAKVRVKWADGSSPTDVDMTDVFALPKAGNRPDAKVGDIVLAKVSTQSYWNGAEITSVEGDLFVVKTVEGQTANVSAEKIIAVPVDVAANFRDKSKSTDMMKDATSKKPTAPADFKAKAGDTVVAEWTPNSWYQGKVQKVSATGITVAWDDGSKPSDLAAHKVMPMPTSKDAMPKQDQFVLVKPESGSKWNYAKVASVKDSSAEIKTADGKSRTLKAGEFILLN